MTAPGPTENLFAHVRVEEATVIDVDRAKWVVTVETKNTAKTVPNVQPLLAYHHYLGGEGASWMPEVGAVCLLLFPSDQGQPVILGYKAVPSPLDMASTADNVDQVMGFRSRRMQQNPGDFVMSTRDGNFIALRRGGVLQVGATSLAQTVFVPIRNWIKSFCENYSLETLGGGLEWRVDRVEDDPAGAAPSSIYLHLREHAQDDLATVRVRMHPAGQSANPKIVWDFSVAPKGINRDDGSVTNEVYNSAVMMDGSKVEFLGMNRSVHVKGDDSLQVDGKRTAKATGDHTVESGANMLVKGGSKATVTAPKVELGAGATQAVIKGTEFVQALAGAQWIVGPGPAAGSIVTLNPASIGALQATLSQVVFTK